MKSVKINATEREDLGSKFARKLRKEGNVPCVAYGATDPLHFYADTLQFRDLVYTAEAVKAEITVGDKKLDAIIQDIQFHPVSDEVMHIDFLELTAGKPVTIEVPVILNGLSKGVRNGGVMKHVFRKVSVRALPKDLPSEINIDVTELRIGQGIRIDELTKEGEYEFMHPDNTVICSIRMARGAMDEEEEDEEGEEGEEGAEGEENAEGGSEGGED